ncbi:hypothetical protein MOK15_15795 [Sphingobium sp. BYY-5]|uniref:hypothetical protein n=1 Tax=Sphingobium sp. BYY-5 TaxID=2926400 RepID=UPI001FA72C4B|nr:hypothetical protein [Sphingobium sp. BYY-5]MCI4591546.1 hypothetical protein [Sphingobium sp. BYY-5]
MKCSKASLFIDIISGGLLVALGLGAGATSALARPPANIPAEKRSDLLVTGAPMAEAPRWATCERLMRDPHFAALYGAVGGNDLLLPTAYLSTRFPRNPDYNAPPAVTEGSALPTLPKTRFGVRRLVVNLAPDAGGSSLDAAILACRSNYTRGGRADNMGLDRISSMAGRAAAGSVMTGPTPPPGGGRSEIAVRDESLPMAFALFDQGRYREALDWFRQAAHKLQWNEGGDEAALFIGKIYLQGLKEQSEPAEAVTWLKKAATASFNPTRDTPMFIPDQPERGCGHPGQSLSDGFPRYPQG